MSGHSNRNYIFHLIILVVSGLLFLPFLGSLSLFDWDEINFAECAREMLISGNFFTVTIDYKPFWEKPPLFIWFQAGMMRLFGVNEFAARLPNALCGTVTLLLLFEIGRKLHGIRFGLTWAGVYMSSILPHLYFRSGIIDPIFNLFIFFSIYLWFIASRPDKNIRIMKRVFLSGIIIGLAMLTKGPVGLILAGLTIFLTELIFYRKIAWISLGLWKLTAYFIFSLWFVWDYLKNGACAGSALPCTLSEFIRYHLRLAGTEDAGHGGFFGYHVVVLALGCFPAFIFAFRYLIGFRAQKDSPYFDRLMLVLFWVVLIIFSAVKTKIVHYSSLAYFPLTYFAARRAEALWDSEKGFRTEERIYIAIVGGLLGIVLTVLPALMMNIEKIMHLIADPFARENLKASVDWSYFQSFLGIFWLGMIFLTLLHTKKKQHPKALTVLGIGSTVGIAGVIYLIIPRAEPYTQGAAIDFFKSLKGKDVYVSTVHYKSYAPYFYAQVPKHKNLRYYAPDGQEWLRTGDIDKPAYFSVKIHKAEEFRGEKYRQAGWQEIGSRNGFVFFRREPVSTVRK